MSTMRNSNCSIIIPMKHLTFSNYNITQNFEISSTEGWDFQRNFTYSASLKIEIIFFPIQLDPRLV